MDYFKSKSSVPFIIGFMILLVRTIPKRVSTFFAKDFGGDNCLVRFAIDRPKTVIFSVFLLLTVVFTFPVVFKIKSAFYGLPGDPSGGIWWGWWWRYASEHHLDLYKIPLLSAPFGVDYSQVPSQALHKYIYNNLYLLINEVTFWNFFIFISFLLSAITMYYLVHYITRDKLSSMVAGIIFAFCPYHLFHSYQHLWMATIQWIPLYVLFLIKLIDEGGGGWKNLRWVKNPFFCAFSFSLVFNENYYYGYFVIIFTMVFLIGCFLYKSLKEKKLILNPNVIPIALIYVTFCLLFTLPFAYPIIRNFLAMPKGIENPDMAYFRSFSELYVYAARLRDYFVPSIDNPFFGKYVQNYVTNRLHGSNLFENTLYLGYVSLILSIFGIVSCWKRKKKLGNPAFISEPNETKLKQWALLFAITGLVMMIFSAPPNPIRFGIKLYFPSYFMHKILPMFRVYARFGLLVMLSVSVLSGIGLFYIFQRITTNKLKTFVAVLVIALIFIEFANFPPSKVTQATEVPEVYKWLRKQEGQFTIAEYPMVSAIEARHYIHQFYQRFHKKKIVNGAQPGTIGEIIRKNVYDLNDPTVPGILASLKTKYVIVHKDIYQEGRLPVLLQKYYDPGYYASFPIEYNNGNAPDLKDSTGFKLVRIFDDSVVYKVISEPAQFMTLYGKHIGKAEDWSDGYTWRWMANNGEVTVINNTKEDKMVSIEFNAASFARVRNLDVSLNGSFLKRLQTGTKKSKYIINDIRLIQGENLIVLHTPEGTDNINAVLHNGDMRDVSIALGEFRIDG